VIVPRLVAELLDDLDLPPLGPEIWADTRIVLPPGNPAEAYRNVLTGEDQSPHSVAGKTTIDAAKMFSEFPVALLLQDCPISRETCNEVLDRRSNRLLPPPWLVRWTRDVWGPGVIVRSSQPT